MAFLVPFSAHAQTATVTLPFSANSDGVTSPLTLPLGSTACVVQFNNIGSATTVTVQGATPSIPTYNNVVTSIGNGGAIFDPALTSYSGSAAGFIAVRLSFSGTVGTYSGNITCGSGIIGGGSTIITPASGAVFNIANPYPTDGSGYQIISPLTLPTFPASQSVSILSTVPVNVQNLSTPAPYFFIAPSPGAVFNTTVQGLGTPAPYLLVAPSASATFNVNCVAGCTGSGGAGATPIPYASDGSGRIVIAPTGLPTPLAVQPISGAPTPIPTPAGGVYPVSGVPTPIPTPAGGVYPISGAPTPIPTPAGGTYPVTGTVSAQSAYAGTANQTLAAASFQGMGCVNLAAPGTLTTGTFNPCYEDLAGNLFVNLATPLVAGTAIVGQFGINQTTPGTTNQVNARLCDTTATTTCSSAGGISSGTQGQNGVNVRAVLQTIAGTAGFGYPVTADQTTGNNYTVPNVIDGGVYYTRIPTTAGTTCTAIETNTHGRVNRVWATGAAETVTISIYDEGATPTCAAADLIWSGTLPVSTTQPVVLNFPTTAGLAYILSGTLTSSVIITRN